VGVHLWLVLHTGVSEPPKAGRLVDPQTYRAWYHRLLEREGVPFWPDAAWRDVALGIGILLAIAALAITVGPPLLEQPPDPTVIEAYPRPDWYFTWIFAALALIPNSLEDITILGAPLVFGILIIALPFFANRGERSPKRRPWALAVVMIALIMIGTLYVAGEQAPWSPAFNAPPLPPEVVGNVSGQAAHGADLFHTKGCEDCHSIAGYGGRRGPDLTYVGDRLRPEQLTIRIVNGGGGMPAYAGTVTSEELSDLVEFLASRTSPAVGQEPSR
jgi:ubiquinol-cytochrome c reductase cytochrome b subunit